MMIYALVFGLGMLAGAGIAAWVTAVLALAGRKYPQIEDDVAQLAVDVAALSAIEGEG